MLKKGKIVPQAMSLVVGSIRIRSWVDSISMSVQPDWASLFGSGFGHGTEF